MALNEMTLTQLLDKRVELKKRQDAAYAVLSQLRVDGTDLTYFHHTCNPPWKDHATAALYMGLADFSGRWHDELEAVEQAINEYHQRQKGKRK